jgi:chloride channel protein, CIC family
MVIGGLVGAGVWRLLLPLAPDLPADPTPFVIVGMMALFGSIAHAPLAVMLMVAEMTGDLTLLAPAMVAVFVAVLVVRDRSIYRSQLPSRADSPAHRARFAMPVLTTIPVREVMRAPRLLLRAGTDAHDALLAMSEARVTGAPLVDAQGGYRGVVDAPTGPEAEAPHELARLTDVDATTLTPDDPLDDALGAIVDAGRRWAPVIEDGRVVGTVSVADVVAGYRAAVAGSARRVRSLHAAGVLLEAVVPPGDLPGRTIGSIPWPAGSVVVSVERAGELVVPRGSTALATGDRLTVLTDERAEPEVRALLDAKDPALGAAVAPA